MELDNIKKLWKEQQTTSYKKEEILAMLRKKSSSVAKWIFIISLLEFAFGFLLNFILPDNDSKLQFGKFTMHFLDSLTIVYYTAIIIFIVLFFINYRKIRVEDGVAQLLSSIVRTRKTLKYYIYYNLGVFFIGSLVVFVIAISQKAETITDKSAAYWIGIAVTATLIIAFGILLFWLFYRLLYGFLLRRLHKNYKEIQKLM